MLNIENEATLRAALKSEINLFVGAAFPIYAKDKSGKKLPTGAELVSELCGAFKENALATQQLPLVSQIIKSKDRLRFNEFLVNRFRVGEHDDRYNSLSKLSISRVFTTNIDDLFNRVFSKPKSKYLNDLLLQAQPFAMQPP